MVNDTGPANGSAPASIDAWRALRGHHLVTAILAARWYAMPDDTIGSWCIMPHLAPPSAGLPTVGSFLAEGIARDIARQHNNIIDAKQRLAARAAQRAAADTWRDQLSKLVQIGDLVHVPAGADACITTTYRILVDEISSYGISGPRIRADGKPIKSRSVDMARPDGLLQGVAEWQLVAKSTVYRGGEPIHTPGDTQ